MIVFEREDLRISWNGQSLFMFWRKSILKPDGWIIYDTRTSYGVLGQEDAIQRAKSFAETLEEESEYQKDVE